MARSHLLKALRPARVTGRRVAVTRARHRHRDQHRDPHADPHPRLTSLNEGADRALRTVRPLGLEEQESR